MNLTSENDLAWLLDNLVGTTPGIRHAVAVSADGLLMTMSSELDRTSGDQLAAIVAGLASLTRGVAQQLRTGSVRQAIVEMDSGFLMLMSISDGSLLAVAADSEADVGLIGYEMAMLVTRAEGVLTPQLIAELRSRLPVNGPLRTTVG